MPAGVFTHSVGVAYKSDEGSITSVTKSFTGDAESGLEASLAVGQVNQHFALAVTKSQIVVMLLYASAAVTIKTNSSTTPQDTITIAAGAQIVWDPSSSAACPFASNVTDFYVTNTDTKVANFKARFLLAV